MTFIPQALADPESRTILVVFDNETDFARWADKVKTIDAPGIATEPSLIKVGDVIDWYITGWNKGEVKAIRFVPDSYDMQDWRSGHYEYTVEGAGFVNARIRGDRVLCAPIYVFPPVSS